MQLEAVSEGVLQEKVFLEISQNSQENTCARASFFANLFKERLWYRCFSMFLISLKPYTEQQ